MYSLKTKDSLRAILENTISYYKTMSTLVVLLIGFISVYPPKKQANFVFISSICRKTTLSLDLGCGQQSFPCSSASMERVNGTMTAITLVIVVMKC